MSLAKTAYLIRRLLNRQSAGMAVGMGMQGFRPIAEIQFVGFIYEALDQMFVQAARMRYRSGGRYNRQSYSVHLLAAALKRRSCIRIPWKVLLFKHQVLKLLFLPILMMQKVLLISAIRDNDPVFFMEHLNLYHAFRHEVPEDEYTVEIGKANVVREGSDVTIITYGLMVHTAVKAAEELEKTGIKVEVIDLRTLMPLDIDTIVASIQENKSCNRRSRSTKNIGCCS